MHPGNPKWEEKLESYVSGPLKILFSGQSAHLRNSLIAPTAVVLIEQAIQEPDKPILAGMGTDLADTALLPLLDVLGFDAGFPPFIFTGANSSYTEKNSNAPVNFFHIGDVAATRHVPSEMFDHLLRLGVARSVEDWRRYFAGGALLDPNLQSGAYWVFDGKVHEAGDLVKVDPRGTSWGELGAMFSSPHGGVMRVAPRAEDYNPIINSRERKELEEDLSQVRTAGLARWKKMPKSPPEGHIPANYQ